MLMSYKNDHIYDVICLVASKPINNDDNNDLPSNSKKEKQPLVENKQSEEQLQIGQDFETEVLEEKNEAPLTPTKQKLDEQLSKAKRKKKTKEKKKRLVKHSSKLAETQLASDLKRELAKQARIINQITKILKPLQFIVARNRLIKLLVLPNCITGIFRKWA